VLGLVAVPPEDGSIERQQPALRPGTRTVAFLLAAYAIGHAALRVWISPVLNIDDAREAIFSQTLAWGYEPRQPPLYTWLVWATVHLAGVSVASLTVLKYAVLVVGYAFAYGIARRILREPRLAPLAAFSLLLLLPVGWFVHDDLTQSVAVLAAAAGTVYALIRLEAAPTAGRYAWLGLALAAGTLSKLTYLVFAGALGLAALSLAPYRRRFLERRMVLSLAVAVVLLFPYALWLAGHEDDLARLYAQQLGAGSARSFVAGVVDGLGAVLRALVYYAAPIGLLFLALFPEIYRPGLAAAGAESPAGQLVGRTLVAGLGLLVVGALLNVLGQLKFRWAIPLFFLLPLCACWRLDRLGVDAVRRRRLRAYAAVLVIAEVLMVGAILLQVRLGARFGVPARLNTPYDAVAAAVTAAGFRRGTIVAGHGPLGGNLRLAFPSSRVVSLESPGYLPVLAGEGPGGECVVVWNRGDAGGIPEDLRAWLRTRLAAEVPPASPVARVSAPYRHGPAGDYRAFYVRVSEGAGRCR
jgi:4-amino-4-deoxy-L-arabinose transferase-like glycosyltransferase